TSIDIEATQDGVMRKRFLEEGESVSVTSPIAILAGADENIDALVREVNETLNGTLNPGDQGAAESDAESRIKVTPRGRRFAKENGIDLMSLRIQGTGYQGGISEKDLQGYLASAKIRVTPVAAKIAADQGVNLDEIQGSGAHGKIMKRDLVQADNTSSQSTGDTGQATADGKEVLDILPYSGVRKIIGERLAKSKFTAPHLYFTQKVDLEKLLELRKQINESQEKKTSVTDYIARAVIMCLQKYPDMNASLENDKIIRYRSVNLGIAVAAPGGLIVPVIKDANHKTVVQLSTEAGILFDKARNGKLSPGEYTGGTFTVSNLGMFGIENFTAIINPPEVGILAVSATKDEAVVVQGTDGKKTIEIKPMMNITLTVDHRVIDGLLAAQFVTDVKRLLENPIQLFL
ncbi:MAG: dihydrolipoamide acetyltransferase, partial [Bacillota bacterium]|nr:dihydrolipoamide acetyltransferase [Bacillota bacterium]